VSKATQGAESAYAFSSPGEAVGAMLPYCPPVSTEVVRLREAIGKVLAAPVRADRDSPAVDVSAMDGYAVNLADASSRRLPVVGEVRIGKEPGRLEPGTALRIVTGGPIPAGAELVIRREDAVEDGEAIAVDPLLVWRAGASIRRRGENTTAGGVVLEAGRVIDPAMVGAMATFGAASVQVFRRVRVGVLVTGDEVLDARVQPTSWQIRDSNGAALVSLLDGSPWLEVVGAGACRAEDDPDEIRSAAESLLAAADALVVTGGVSMGVRDFVPSVLQSVGARVLFHKVPQRPGKPVLGAVIGDRVPVMALPGNPVSVMVTARRMLMPCLARLAGIGMLPPLRMVTLSGHAGGIPLWWHRPVRLLAGETAEVVEGRGSGDIVSAAGSDGFVEIPPDQTGPGPWPFYPWSAGSAG